MQVWLSHLLAHVFGVEACVLNGHLGVVFLGLSPVDVDLLCDLEHEGVLEAVLELLLLELDLIELLMDLALEVRLKELVQLLEDAFTRNIPAL